MNRRAIAILGLAIALVLVGIGSISPVIADKILPNTFELFPQSCTHWDLASDFRQYPNQENPNRDSCGTMNVWHYMRSADFTRNPQTYSLLPHFEYSLSSIPGHEAWYGDYPHPRPNPDLPVIGRNCTNQFVSTIPPHTIWVHPSPIELAIVGWRSPISSHIVITGSVTDIDAGAGDGILWYIDKGSVNLYAADVPNGGAQNFSLDDVPVSPGEFIYFAVHPKEGMGWDSTVLTISISSKATELMYLPYISKPAPTPTPTPTVTPVQKLQDGHYLAHMANGGTLKFDVTNSGTKLYNVSFIIPPHTDCLMSSFTFLGSVDLWEGCTAPFKLDTKTAILMD